MVRPGSVAADIGCDHGKLSAALLASGRCPAVIAADLRPEPLKKAENTLRERGVLQHASLRLGNGLEVVRPGEAQDYIFAGMGAETILQILDAAPWIRDPGYRLIFVPATKHSLLRQGLCRRGFALRQDRVVQAAGRLYAVLAAEYDGKTWEPDGVFCVTGKTVGQPLAGEYRAMQLVKIRKYLRGCPPQQAAAVRGLIERLEAMDDGNGGTDL